MPWPFSTSAALSNSSPRSTLNPLHVYKSALAKLVRTDDDLADLIACLLHSSARDAKYRVDVPRDLEEAESDRRVEDLVLAGTRRLERFTLVKK